MSDAEIPPEPFGEVLTRIEELAQAGFERQALDLLVAAFERRDEGTLEDLALMAEISLDLWLHADAAQVATEALLREGLSLSPEMLERPVVRRLARTYARGFYFEARSMGESVQAPQEADSEVMDATEMLAAAAEVLRRLTAGGTDDAEDFYWLAAVLLETREREAARAALARYEERVPLERRLSGFGPIERCIVGFWQRVTEPKDATGEGEEAPPTSEESEATPPAQGGPERASPTEVQPPRKIEIPMPGYTEAARRAAIHGVVILQAVIDTDGRPVCVRPIQGLPFGLSEKAAEAVSRWRFEPARHDGEPVSVYYNLTVNYRLE